ncbi:MAG TPA: LamG domain-containing protein [Dehalococcoidia bacterium]|nr:LamG domain-containing protein [Dehalococcoidia bacterium]
MAGYNPGLEAKLDTILGILGTTKRSLWPFWEKTGVLVTGIGVGDLIPAETSGTAEALEDDFSPLLLPCGLFSYHFHPTGDHHLKGIDSTDYSFGDGSVDSAFSVGCWIRPNAIASNVLLAKYDSAGMKEEWRFWIDGDGKLDLELHDASASATEIAVSDAALTVGLLQFVVATYDGTQTAPEVNLYVDGQLVNDGLTVEDGSYVAMEDTDAPLTIGCGGVTATPTTEFHGRIAMPFITGKELSAAEVSQLYNLMNPMVGLS